MPHPNQFDLGISTNKPHLRNKGEEVWWEKCMESHIKTNDYQCWRVVEKGDGYVNLSQAEAEWKPEHYVTLKKNAKARQFILNGLGREDMDKVISIPTAKEMWKALKEMHEGSEELKRSRKFALEGEFHTFKMLETESISEYYSRFTRLAAKLTAAGVTLDDVSKSLVIINGLNSKFSLIKGILKNTPGGQSLPLTQIIGKLEVEEGEHGKESSTKKAEKGNALKISKAFSRIELEEENSDIEEETDEMTALFAKHIKRNFNKGKFKKSFQKKRHQGLLLLQLQ